MTQVTERVPEFDLADRMRKALREADIGVQEMAEYLEVSRNAVGTWINGRNRPSPQTVRLWALRCGVPYEWLRHGTVSVFTYPDPAPGDGKATAPYLQLLAVRREHTDSYVAARKARQHAPQPAGRAA